MRAVFADFFGAGPARQSGALMWRWVLCVWMWGALSGTAEARTDWAATQLPADPDAAAMQGDRFSKRGLPEGFNLQPRPSAPSRVERHLLQDLQRGRVAYGWVPLRTLATSVPELALLLEPYLFTTASQAQFVYERYLYDLVNKIVSSRGVVLLGWTPLPAECLRSQVPLRLPEDAIGQGLHSPNHWTDQSFAQVLSADHLAPNGVEPRYVLTTQHRYLMGAVLAYKSWFDEAEPQWQTDLRERHRLSAARLYADERLEANCSAEHLIRLKIGPHERAQWASAAAAVRPDLLRGVMDRGGDRVMTEQLLEAIERGKRMFNEQRGSIAGQTAR